MSDSDAPTPGDDQPDRNQPNPYGQPSYGQPVYGQPAYGAPYGQQPPGMKPASYLAGAIVSTLLCCLPAGIVSIVYAARVDSAWNMGDFRGALDASNKARTWMWVSVGLGLIPVAIVVVVLIGGAFAGAGTRY